MCLHCLAIFLQVEVFCSVSGCSGLVLEEGS